MVSEVWILLRIEHVHDGAQTLLVPAFRQLRLPALHVHTPQVGLNPCVDQLVGISQRVALGDYRVYIM